MNVQTPLGSRPVMSERRVGLIGAMLVAIGPVSMALYTPAMPQIVHAFATTEAAVKLTLSTYFAGFAMAQLVCGPLSDGLGRKPVTYGFLAIYLVGSLLAMVAPSIEILLAARLLQGVGAAVGWAIARAVVRDLFTNERAARIVNLMAMILSVGPAMSPVIGGITMELAGWHAIFVLMFVAAAAIILVVRLLMVETVERDLSRIRPGKLVSSYRQVLASRYFLLSSLVLAGSLGALYTLATILPFVLIERVGLTPTQFGAGMLMQSFSFFVGSVLVGRLLRRMSSTRLVPVGLAFIGLGSAALATTLRVDEASFLGVMVPVGIFAFGIAFVMPAMSTAALAPFPHIAGAASSLSGFFQMTGGLVGGLICAAMGDPVAAMATVVPAMGLMAVVSWALWRRMPLPKAASIVHAPPAGPPAE